MSIRPGREYHYEDIIAACEEGRYPSSAIRAASGRPNRLLGVPPEGLRELERAARELAVGLILTGSRISGPRARQRTLHPALTAMPLRETKRSASASFQGAESLLIDKSVIKDYGPEDPRSSDLTVLLVDAHRTEAEVSIVAEVLERRLNALGWGLPVRVYGLPRGFCYRSEQDYLDADVAWFRAFQPPGSPYSDADLQEAMKETYFTLNLPPSVRHIGEQVHHAAPRWSRPG